MNPTRRTVIFVAVAAVSIGAAAITHQLTKPPKVKGYELVGEPFYPDFDDPNKATALRVVDYNEDTASANVFNVEFKDGAWRIPSHHNYPAEGTEQLAKTAASVIGIERGALVSRLKSDHERFGVVDPLDDTTTTLKGRGQRLTLFKDDGIVLADFIIGKKVEGEDNVYYVRRQDEEETYRTKLEINLSTKFSDWIEPDLLKLERNDLIAMTINHYSLDPTRGAIQQRDVTRLTRTKSPDPWTLDGLNEQTEQVNTDKVRDLVNKLDNLKIVGVRPKPKGLTSELTLDSKVVQDPRLEGLLLAELQSKGFFVAQAQGDTDQRRLYSKEGELTAATNHGVVYHLNFGNMFTGTEKEIEIGGATNKEASKAEAESASRETKDAKTDSSDAQDSDAKADKSGEKPSESKSNDKSDTQKPGRYLFVRVEFDEQYLGPKPEKPVEPKKPAGLEENGNKDKTAPDSGKASDSQDTAKQKQDQKQDKKDPKAEYEQAKQKYDADFKQYKTDLKTWDDNRDAGKKTVEDLNRRFGEWYYVISGQSFEQLTLDRADLVKPKEEKTDGKTNASRSSKAGATTPNVSPQHPVAAPKPH